MSNLEKSQFFKINPDFSCNSQYREFEEEIGYYWDNLDAAGDAIKKWVVSGGCGLFRARGDIKNINVYITAAELIVEANVSGRKHLGYECSQKNHHGARWGRVFSSSEG